MGNQSQVRPRPLSAVFYFVPQENLSPVTVKQARLARPRVSMLLFFLLIVKPIFTLERKNGLPTNPTSVRKDPIANFARVPTFSPIFSTTFRSFASLSGLERQRRKKAVLGKKQKETLFPIFFLTTQPPRQDQAFPNSLTYRGVSRPLVDLLRSQLRQTPPASSSISSSTSSLNMTKANATPCSFLSGSLLPLSGICTASGACRVGRTDYQASGCKTTIISVGGHCEVNRPLKRTRGTCSSEGHCVGRGQRELRWNQLQCLMNNLKPR